MRVRYFAAARDATGLAEEELQLDDGPRTVADVRTALLLLRPALARVLGQSRLAVDLHFAAEGDAVTHGAELAVIPPVSGG